MSDIAHDLIDRLRIEVQRGTAEVRADMREGFDRLEDQMRTQGTKLARHSERVAALERKKRGPAIGATSGGYPTLSPRQPQPWWVVKIVWPGVAALAGVVATKAAPILFAHLAELTR